MKGQLAALLLLVLAPGPAWAWVQSSSSSGAGLLWTTNCLTLYVHEGGSEDIGDGEEFEAVEASLATWSEVECSGVTLRYGGETNLTITGYTQEDPPVNLIIWRERHWPYSMRPVAYTAVTYNANTGVILDADIELNAEDYVFTTRPNQEPWKIDLQNTVTHELGHVIGLDHPPVGPGEEGSVPEATMAPNAGPGETSKRTLHEDDIDGLCTLYPLAGAEQCEEAKPQFLFYDFPEEPADGGCGVGGAPAAAALWPLLVMVVWGWRRRR